MLGLLVVDHGSRRPEANDQLLDMVARVAGLTPGTPIASAHLDICAPTIGDGIATLLARGVDEIAVLLYVLSDGRHVREDVPALVRAALAARPDVRVRLGGALGPDDVLARLMLERAGVGCDGRDADDPART
jgi:sirohydrochlorin ferrochelatase